MAGDRCPLSRTNLAYSAFVTGWTLMKKSATCTRCTGRSSSSASSDPIKNSPAWIRASSGARSDGIGAPKDSASAISTTLSPMKLEPFALERFQSIWENRVAWNVAESGVHPLRVSELIDSAELHDALMEQTLGYPQTNGTAELREAIAAIYPGATPDHVQVTNGGSEANCILLMKLVEPGDE